MKILNLYARIGGNRKLWGNEHKITAVEIVPEIAALYHKFFPEDRILVEDAHQYLLEHYEEYDFIWSSPPCQTHSRIRNIAGVGRRQNKPVYPDMNLYSEILFLNQVYNSSGCDFNGFFIVENVASYYQPLIRPYKVGRHYFWSNFYISPFDIKTRGHMLNKTELAFLKHMPILDLQLLRNCVEPELGLHVFECAFKKKQIQLTEVCSEL
jgi:DNA (cytosine-5)-methyltransferase 1